MRSILMRLFLIGLFASGCTKKTTKETIIERVGLTVDVEDCTDDIESAIPFAAGTGGPSDPYVICSADQLDRLSDFTLDHFVLGKDIDLAAHPGFMIEVHSNQPFQGVLDGRGHSIKNLNFNGTGAYALFATIQNAKIYSLNLTDVSISTDQEGAPLASSLAKSKVSGIKVTGMVNGISASGLATNISSSELANIEVDAFITGQDYAGGLAVFAVSSPSDPSNHFAQIKVHGEVSSQTVGGAAGGIIGESVRVLIDEVLITAQISAAGRAGGAVGYANTSTQVTNAKITGAVSCSGVCNAGGVIGDGSDPAAATILLALVTGPVSGSTARGFIGSDTNGLVASSLWAFDASDLLFGTRQALSGGGFVIDTSSATDADLKSPATYSSFSESIWKIIAGAHASLLFSL